MQRASASVADPGQLFSASYGPTKTLAENLDDDRREELRQKWVEFFEGQYGDGRGGVSHGCEYVLVVGTRR